MLGPSLALLRAVQNVVAAASSPGEASASPSELQLIAVSPTVSIALAATALGLSISAVNAAIATAVSASVLGLSVSAVNATGATNTAKAIVDAAIGAGSVISYYRADLGRTDSGSQVTAWNDLTGNSWHWTAPGLTATWPTLQTGANSQACLFFDGIDDYFQNSYAPPAPGTTPSWIWCVLEQVSGGTPWTNGEPLWNSQTGFVQELFQSTSTPQVRAYNGTSGPLNNNLVLDNVRRLENYFSNSTSDYLKIGATSVTGTNTGNTSGGTGRRLGRDSGTNYGRFRIYELMRVNQDPGATAKTNLDAYAVARYGAAATA